MMLCLLALTLGAVTATPVQGFGLLSADFSFHSDSSWRAAADPYQLGSNFNVEVNPLDTESQGLRGKGETLAAKARVQAYRPYLAMEATPAVSFRWRDGDYRPAAFFHEAWARAHTSSVAFSVGRQTFDWRLNGEPGLLLTKNARPMDVLRLHTLKDFSLPWFFSHLGFFEADVFLATLGESGHRPGRKLFGTRLVWKPTANLDLGFAQTLMFDGEGAPSIEWYEVLLESFSRRKRNTNEIERTNAADHRLNWFMAARFPSLKNMSISYEGIMDDYRSGMLSSFSNFRDFHEDNVGYQVVMKGPELIKRSGFGAVYRRLPYHLYLHGEWKAGYSMDQRFLGSGLGAQTRAYEFFWRQAVREYGEIDMRFGILDRRADRFHPNSEPRRPGGISRVNVLQRFPQERSYYVNAAWEMPLIQRGWFLRQEAGLERVMSMNFVEGRDRGTYRLGSSLVWRAF
jgi:hypothetical protein